MLLSCENNQLESLYLTQNPNLFSLKCANNQLSCLNIKNTNIDLQASAVFNNYLYTTDNPNLSCIEVNNVVTVSNSNVNIDPQTSFSTNCDNSCSTQNLRIEDLEKRTDLSLYPNPTKGTIFVELEANTNIINISLINSLGEIILTQNIESSKQINLDINARKGIYYLQLETLSGKLITKKIVKE